MKRLTPSEKIALLEPAAAVYRALELADTTLSYRDFARAIGMTGNWAHLRFHLNAVLHALGAIYGKDGLPYHRVVNARTGKPGLGVAAYSRVSVQ